MSCLKVLLPVKGTVPFEAISICGKFTLDTAPYVVQRSAAMGITLLSTVSFIVCNRMQEGQGAEYLHRKGMFDEGLYMLLTASDICRCVSAYVWTHSIVISMITKVTVQIGQQLAEMRCVKQAHAEFFSSLKLDGPSTSHHGNTGRDLFKRSLQKRNGCGP